MIKCIGYLKSLKQLLSILLISCFIFGLGSFVNATYQEIGLDFKPSSLNNKFSINVIPKGGFITNYLGVSKSVLGFSNTPLFFWDTDGIPYYYKSDSIQGYFNIYYLCDYFGSGGTTMLHCSSSNISDNLTALNNFFSSIVNGDYFYYSVQTSDNYFCWSSQYYNNSICFKYNGSSSLTGSKGYSGLLFGNINSSMYLTYPFGINGGNNNSQGSSSTDIITGLTGDYSYSTCTNGEILSMLGNMGYNKYLCYGGLDNFDLWDSSGSYSPIPGTGKRLSQILSYSSSWDTPQEWFEYWNGLYQDKDNPLYYTLWESYPAVYRTWFDMYYNYNGPGKKFDDIREYCVMSVDLSLNPDTVYNGTQFKNICSAIIDIKQNPDSTYNQSGVIVGVNWKGVGNLSGDSKTATQFIQDFFNTIKAQINTNYDGPGFIPAYIILFMLVLIFFRFISH